MTKIESKEFWQENWREHDTPWNLNGPHPYLNTLISEVQRISPLHKGSRIHVPGCGHGHDAAELARRGYEVIADDFVPEAIEEAQRLYHHVPGLTLRVQDVFQVSSNEIGSFDGILDRAMMCALPPSKWAEYLEACKKRLKPSGLFIGILFSKTRDPEGPPFSIDLPQLKSLLQNEFDLLFVAEKPNLTSIQFILSEALVIASRR